MPSHKRERAILFFIQLNTIYMPSIHRNPWTNWLIWFPVYKVLLRLFRPSRFIFQSLTWNHVLQRHVFSFQLVGVTIDGREIRTGGDGYKSTSMHVNGTSMGAHSRPIAWNAGGSTKPPMVDNYLDSYGLNAGLGNASYTKFPSVVETKPLQARIYAFVLHSHPFGVSCKNNLHGDGLASFLGWFLKYF